MVFSEIAVVGSLVGNYNELVELKTMAGQGRVNLHAAEYKLDDINTAIHDLHHGQIQGRGPRICFLYVYLRKINTDKFAVGQG